MSVASDVSQYTVWNLRGILVTIKTKRTIMGLENRNYTTRANTTVKTKEFMADIIYAAQKKEVS